MRFAILSALVLLALAGCDPSGDAARVVSGGAGLAACVPDAGAIYPAGECVTHEDCPQDARCVSGTCLADPPACGRPRDTECTSNVAKDDCWRMGGEWVCGYFNPDQCSCHCPTNDYKCPCWKESHCQGKCMGERVRCDGTREIGFCSRVLGEPLGCRCWIYNDVFTEVCTD